MTKLLASEYIDIALRSGVVYLALLMFLRAAGKRHTGQLSPHDFVLVLLVANALQSAMVGTSTSVGGGLIAAGVLIVLNVVITRLVLRSQRLRPLVVGSPTLLIHNGNVLDDACAREGILRDELEAQLRAHGFEHSQQVKSAVQEVDGSISVIGFGPIDERRMPAMAPSVRASARA